MTVPPTAHAHTAYRRCTRCVMDTTDPDITFDAAGVCNHCRNFDAVLRSRWKDNPEGEAELRARIETIKQENAKRDYDCILGLSGGVDSSYLAIKVVEYGLRPLVVHVDAGWNSELAVQNIERLVKVLKLDLHTIVIDWEEIRDLQIAFLRSGVANQDVPQDHAFFAGLYKFAISHKVNCVLSGGNLASESILPSAWGYDAMDSRHLKSIHRRFGSRPLKTFPIVSFWDLFFFFPFMHKMRVLRPLDYLPYDKIAAKKLLMEKYGWRDYGAKHYESVWTKFFQGYYLPGRFGYDKRLAHLSSLIVAGQLTRDDALAQLEREHYPAEDLRRDRAFVIKKLGLTEKEFEELLHAPITTHRDYESNEELMRRVKAVVRRLPFKAWLKKPFRA
ncbi:MAG TPA: N-acetyl sugar amidotransferase [Opitutaceae bacterium]